MESKRIKCPACGHDITDEIDKPIPNIGLRTPDNCFSTFGAAGESRKVKLEKCSICGMEQPYTCKATVCLGCLKRKGSYKSESKPIHADDYFSPVESAVKAEPYDARSETGGRYPNKSESEVERCD